jgi:hypothetical protein
MLIPSIDLQGGAVVQLVQGEHLAIRDEDVFRWVRRFERFPKVQVIDLDAAMGKGDNIDIVRQIAGVLSCRVGGGIRTVERARDVLAAGARQIIAGSSLFKNGQPDLEFAKQLADAVGAEQVIAAVDSRGGHVTIHGWKTVLPVRPWMPFAPWSRSAVSSSTRTSTPKASCAAPILKDSGRAPGHHAPRDRRRRHYDATGNRRPPSRGRRFSGRHGHLHRSAPGRRTV